MALLSAKQTKSFIEQVLSRKGCPYCWPTAENSYSGKDLDGAKYQKTYDCSGLVTSSLFSATGIDRRTTWNAQRLFENCSKVDKPIPGDLVFYGPSRAHITHVMVYMKSTSIQKDSSKDAGGVVFGSSGGDSRTTTPEIAKQMNANVRGHSSVNYRPDFVAFGRLETNHV